MKGVVAIGLDIPVTASYRAGDSELRKILSQIISDRHTSKRQRMVCQRTRRRLFAEQLEDRKLLAMVDLTGGVGASQFRL